MFRIRRCKNLVEQQLAKALHTLLFEHSMWSEEHAQYGMWLVWNEDGEPVGFGALGMYSGEPEAAFISYIGLLAEARGSGLGPRLIRTMLREADRQGFERVVSYTWNDNVPSARSFFRTGFQLYRPAGAAPDYMWFEKNL